MHAAPTIALAFTLIPLIATAEVEIRGSEKEVAEFAESVGGKIVLTANAEEAFSSKSANVELSIVNKAEKLGAAIKENSELGAKLRKTLIASGIEAASITSQELASTPEYGWFSDKPKSYTVASGFRVRINQKAHFLAIANFVDSSDDIRYVGIEPYLELSDTIEEKLEAATLAALAEKRQIYEEAYGVRLTVHTFTECKVTRVENEYQMPTSKSGYALGSRVPSRGRDISMGDGIFRGTLSATYTLSAE